MLGWREVTMLRSVARYLRQVGIPFSDRYMEQTLLGHADVARALVALFHARFDPDGDRSRADACVAEIEAAIDAVDSLDEDRILRGFLSVVRAMLRTNYYLDKPYVSFKLDPKQVPLTPLPRPQFEIFVHSPRVEGVHLRGGSVARGGLRWSDRREDFRTEILGLMKAQMVKNALIVPVGAKGGFVVKRAGDEVVACYTTFISALLDISDTYSPAGEVIPPEGVVRHDGDDPYLVVAADKGTATFSDIANGVAEDYGFWLGDAFASGGSVGYDHKAMGITARSAWVSVQRHFRELGVDVQAEDFTVAGIGDMSGDVFGNGMLLSEHIRLVAAFDHRHIFLDPNPDAASSHAERARLFEVPRSSWADYDTSLISEGGGVFPRTAKSIPLTEQVREALDVEAESLTPIELMSAILRAPVDLLWNGGIGTYVKSKAETHADVGDKANDALRINGSELRAKVVGEGGNLGFTQRGRIEFALGGGKVNTDAIDNAGGVNCSDHEVNIKVLLDTVVAEGDMTVKQRNALLAEMTEAVAERVLRGSYTQTQALSLARVQAPAMLEVHERVMRDLEAAGRLDRAIEALPDAELIAERRTAGLGLTQPELAVMLAYSKIVLYAELLDSDLPEDPALDGELDRYFPSPLPERFGDVARRHRLKREIVATRVTNDLIDRAGSTFAFRLRDDTGASMADIARASVVSRDVFNVRSLWADVEALDGSRAGRDPVRHAALLAADGRALDALAAALAAAAAGHRRRARALRRGRQDRRGAAPGRARRARAGELARARRPAHRGGRAGGAGRPRGGAGRALLGAGHRRHRAGHRASGRGGRRAALRDRRQPAPALAARPDRAARPRHALGGDGPRRAARRPLQPARRAHHRRAARGRRRRVDRRQGGRGRARAGDPGRDPLRRHLRPHHAARGAAGGAQPDRAGLVGGRARAGERARAPVGLRDVLDRAPRCAAHAGRAPAQPGRDTGLDEHPGGREPSGAARGRERDAGAALDPAQVRGAAERGGRAGAAGRELRGACGGLQERAEQRVTAPLEALAGADEGEREAARDVALLRLGEPDEIAGEGGRDEDRARPVAAARGWARPGRARAPAGGAGELVGLGRPGRRMAAGVGGEVGEAVAVVVDAVRAREHLRNKTGSGSGARRPRRNPRPTRAASCRCPSRR